MQNVKFYLQISSFFHQLHSSNLNLNWMFFIFSCYFTWRSDFLLWLTNCTFSIGCTVYLWTTGNKQCLKRRRKLEPNWREKKKSIIRLKRRRQIPEICCIGESGSIFHLCDRSVSCIAIKLRGRQSIKFSHYATLECYIRLRLLWE